MKIYLHIISQLKKKKTNYKMTNVYNYTYFISLYSKDSIYDNQILNTTAFILYDKSKSYDNHCENKTDNPNEDFSCIFSNISHNKPYILYMFIKIKDKNSKEYYLSNFFEIEIKQEKNKTIRILLIIFCSIFILTIIAIILFFTLRNKNNSLKEKIKKISFFAADNEYNNEQNEKRNEDDIPFI